MPYTGLVERLTQITLICGVGKEAQEHLSKSDVVDLLDQVSGLAQDAPQFSWADPDELERVHKYLLDGMRADRE